MAFLTFLTGAAGLYLGAVGALYALQDRLLFPRHRLCGARYPLPEEAQALDFETADGFRLKGVFLPAAGRSRGLMLGFSGNVWDAQDMAVFLHNRVTDYDIVGFHYRGYPPSEGEPSETALLRDAEEIHDALVERLRPACVMCIGFSLGSGVAAHLAAARQLDGVILATPFDSIEAVARARYRWAPVNWLLRHPFRSQDKLRGNPTPVAVITAGRDRIIEPERTAALISSIDRLVFERVFPEAGHASIYDDPAFAPTLREALAALEEAGSGAALSA